VAQAAVQEELIHAAFFRAVYEQAGQSGLPFEQLQAAQMAAIFAELDASPTGQQAFLNAANLYDRTNARSRGAYRSYPEARAAYQGREGYLITELARQLIQLRTQADTTESAFRKAVGLVQKWLKAALAQLRKVAADPAAASPTLAQAIQETEAILNNQARSWRTMVPMTAMQYAAHQAGTTPQLGHIAAARQWLFGARTPQHQPFRVRQLGLRALLTGSPLPRSLHEVLQHTQAEKAALDSAFARIASMMEAGVAAAVARTGQTVAAVHTQVNAALDGNPGAMTVLQAIGQGGGLPLPQ
jgi:hypothetical protein